jgi:hypothetical protein
MDRMPADWRPPRQERTLHYEIERIGKRVYTIKLFYRHGGMRDKVFLRHTIDGNWEEAKRQAAVLLELQGLKDG